MKTYTLLLAFLVVCIVLGAMIYPLGIFVANPDYISSTGQYGLDTSNLLCANINEERIWEVGESVGDVERRIENTVTFSIDNNLIVEEFVSVSRPLEPAYLEYDTEGNFIGSYGGGISVCTIIDELDKGYHSASISFEAKSGQSYQYNWEFEVK